MTTHTPTRGTEVTPPPRPARLSPGRRRRLVVWGLAAVAGLGAAAGAGVLTGVLPDPVVAGPAKPVPVGDPAAAAAVSVKVIRPKHDPSVRLTVEQLAVVEPYYRADLRARASGTVKAVYAAIGDRVRQGDVLVEIDAPDLTQDVAQKEAVVVQRQQEVRVARANLRNAEAGRGVAAAAVKEKDALVAQAEATRDFRRKRLDRYKALAASGSLVAGALDEEERDYLGSEAALRAAQAGAERGRSDLAESQAKVEAATADIDLKTAQVEVARRDRDRALAVLDFARLTAPFDGEVVRCTVEQGSFVQNATTGQSDPLVSVARTDLVTVVARVPDSAAGFVSAGTEVEIAVDGHEGPPVAGRVTRFAPVIDRADRTMRVEVDLFNGDASDFRHLIDRLLAGELAPLGGPDPWAQVAARVVSQRLLDRDRKGAGDFLPAGTAARSGGNRGLLAGATGVMRLHLGGFHGGYVVPSTAVYTRGGKPYLLLVEGGVTRQHPVTVQLNDGRVAKVTFAARRDETAELTGRELVVTNRQLEIGEGAAVQAAPADW